MSPKYSHDPRIGAAVIAAPLGLVFSEAGLRDVSVPVQLWRAEHDALATHPYNVEAVYRALPRAAGQEPDYRVVAGAGHFAFLAPCSPRQAQAVPRVCKDRPGFDRIAFHKDFNAEIVAFFDRHLTGR